MNNIQSKIEECEEDYDLKMGKLADEYREDVLIPFCKKYGMGFIILSGYFYFYYDDNRTVCGSDIEQNYIPNFVPKDAIPELKEIIGVLNIQSLEEYYYFGYYVKPVDVRKIVEPVANQ
jgi:hypothetical protein